MHIYLVSLTPEVQTSCTKVGEEQAFPYNASRGVGHGFSHIATHDMDRRPLDAYVAMGQLVVRVGNKDATTLTATRRSSNPFVGGSEAPWRLVAFWYADVEYSLKHAEDTAQTLLTSFSSSRAYLGAKFGDLQRDKTCRRKCNIQHPS